jgi:hypothetical protein
MPTTSAYEQIAADLKTIIDSCYTAEGWVGVHDELHESLGFDQTRIGIAQDERGDIVSSGNALVQETWVVVRFQGKYDLKVDPLQSVDPRIVANYAERFRRAIQTANVPSYGTNQTWFYDIREIRYPRDPTGNKTRFFATIRAYGNNSGLVETIG